MFFKKEHDKGMDHTMKNNKEEKYKKKSSSIFALKRTTQKLKQISLTTVNLQK